MDARDAFGGGRRCKCYTSPSPVIDVFTACSTSFLGRSRPITPRLHALPAGPSHPRHVRRGGSYSERCECEMPFCGEWKRVDRLSLTTRDGLARLAWPTVLGLENHKHLLVPPGRGIVSTDGVHELLSPTAGAQASILPRPRTSLGLTISFRHRRGRVILVRPGRRRVRNEPYKCLPTPSATGLVPLTSFIQPHARSPTGARDGRDGYAQHHLIFLSVPSTLG